MYLFFIFFFIVPFLHEEAIGIFVDKVLNSIKTYQELKVFQILIILRKLLRFQNHLKVQTSFSTFKSNVIIISWISRVNSWPRYYILSSSLYEIPILVLIWNRYFSILYLTQNTITFIEHFTIRYNFRFVNFYTKYISHILFFHYMCHQPRQICVICIVIW